MGESSDVQMVGKMDMNDTRMVNIESSVGDGMSRRSLGGKDVEPS
jgi:hypothetical protein